MNRHIIRLFPAVTFLLSLALSVLLLAGVDARAQCTALISGLESPLGITQSNQGNLIFSETGATGAAAPHSGRISILDPSGNRRTLLSGLPAAINDVGEPSGPAGVFMRGRTLYVVIGIGNNLLPGPPMTGIAFENPTPASPIFSSVLAVHFSANVEKNTTGFALSFPADEAALASGQKLTLSNGGGDKITIELIANFPNFTPNPRPDAPLNVRGVNPFDLVVVGDQIYVTDGGQNSVWQVDSETGAFSTLATFPNVTNAGGSTSEAVPTGITYADGQLLVTLFSGVPFLPGSSRVEQVDPSTGAITNLISGRKTAIDVLQISEGGDTDYLVLQLASPFGPFFPPPGLVLRFESPAAAPTTVASCLLRPTSMVLDEKTGTLYITQLGTGPPAMPAAGSVVSVQLP